MPIKSVRKKSLSYFILLALEKAVDGYVRFEDFAYKPGRYIYGDPESLKKSSFAESIRRLREGGLIEKSLDEGKVVLKITGLGREALGDHFDESKWDGKWRIVIFDIPEDKRGVRRILRSRLKLWEFRMWQQSVWVTKRDVTEKLRKLLKALDIEKWVAVIESDNASIDHTIWSGRT